MATSNDIANSIISQADSVGVNPALALEVAIEESSLNQNARGAAGEIGVFQLKPSSFPGVNISDLQTNIETGVGYLSSLLGMFGGDQSAALAAYNWGPSKVENALAQYGQDWLANAPSGVQNYVATILGNMASEYSVYADTPAAAASQAAPGTNPPPPANSSTWIWFAAGTIALVAAAVLWGSE